MLKDITSANIGSAVRWVITSLGTYLAAKGIGDAGLWAQVAGGGAAIVMLVWSFMSNEKKVA